MSSDDIDLGQQTHFASELSKSLAAVNTRLSTFADHSRTQAQFATQISESFKKTSDNINSLSTNTDTINQTLQNFMQNMQSVSNNPGVSNFFNSFMTYMDETNKRYQRAADATEGLADAAERHQTASQQSQESLKKAADQDKKFSSAQQKQTKEQLSSLNNLNKKATQFNETQEEFAKASEEAEKAGKSWIKTFKSVLSAGFGLIKVLGSLIGAATTFVKTVLTLPFMVLDNVVKVGNALREDIVVTIGQAAQDSKEFFDSFSGIGQGITKMTNMGKGMLLEFELVNSEAVKLFDMGAAGIANMIKETTSAIKAMGHYSEMFGSSITNSKDSLFHFTRIKKAIGLEDEQIAYYAQDAGVNLISLNDRLTSMAIQTDLISKQYGVDLKRLGKNFNKLRVDIALYGHLSDEELLKTTARLTQMKISVEDASNVFKKFNTFEDAANSVAMLSQTFGMNLDAMEIIQAENPIEIIDMFRNSMIATGRTFDELNRFEKEIMADQTGMTQESLKALMTLRDQGLTHQEAVDAMKDQTPEAKQLKAIKELSSSISQLQKVMTFTSPFEAFLKGLGRNSAASKEAREAFMSLSNTYQMIHDFAANLDGDTIDALMEPVIIIVDTMNEIFNSKAFTGGLSSLVEGFGEIAMNLFGVTSSDRIFHELKKNLTGMTPRQEKQLATDLTVIEKDIKGSSSQTVKDLYVKYMEKSPKLKTTSAKFQAFLKNFKKEAAKNPDIKKEYEAVMKNFHKGYTMASFNKLVKTKKGVRKLMSNFENRVDNIFTGNTGNFEKFFDVAGLTAGAIIKGAAILLTSGVNLLNHIIDEVDLDQIGNKTGQKNILESFFDWDAGDMIDMAEGIGKALGGLFARGGKLAFFGTWLFEQMSGIFGNVIRFFWVTLKEIGSQIFPNIFGGESIQDVITKKQRGKAGYTKKSDIRKGGGFTDASQFNIADSASQKSAVLKMDEVGDKAKGGSKESSAIAALRAKAEGNTFTKADYEHLSIIEGALGAGGVGKSNNILDVDPAVAMDRDGKRIEFDNALKSFYKNHSKKYASMMEKIEKKRGIKRHDEWFNRYDKNKILTGTFARHIHKMSDKLSDIDSFTKSSLYYKLFGEFLANKANKKEPALPESKLWHEKSADYKHTTKDYDLKAFQNDNKWFGHTPFFVEQFLYHKGTRFASGETKVNDGGGINSNTIAAKPGGVAVSMMSDIATMSGQANNIYSDINSLYSSSSIESPYRITTNKAKEHKENVNKIKEEAKKPKQCDYTIPITPEFIKTLMPMFKESGFLKILMDTRYMSPDGSRVAPEACIMDTLSNAKPGMFPANDYDY